MADKLPFRSAAPDRAQVILRHEFDFDPVAWKSELAEPIRSWPAALDTFSPSPRPKGENQNLRKINRGDVLDLLDAATSPEKVLQGYAAAMVWACGTGTRSRRRCLKALGGKGALWLPEGLEEKLLKALEIARTKSPVDAYEALHGKSSGSEEGLWIHGLGPAYGTKLLYFGAYESHGGSLKPLIMDSYVVTALNRLRGTAWNDGNWGTEQYREYLELADEWARQWGTEPDVVERVLFEVGQSRKLAIASLLD